MVAISQPEGNIAAAGEDQRGDAWEPHDPNALPIISCAGLLQMYPERRPPVIEGLLRVGETMNVIAAPKVGKSWLTLSLAFAVATGRPWLSRFATTQRKVLLIDNELHPETSAHRLRILANALKLPIEDVGTMVHVVNLRGRLKDLPGLGVGLLKIERGRYALAIIDALYRTLPGGADENDNATMAGLYNQLDCYAEAIGAAFALVHHSSKGDQSSKSVTDVGAGAGAQSRATDTHLILRPHEEDNVVVLDAAARSWPPVDPLCLRWDFPTWTPALDLDPTALRTPNSRRRRPEGEGQPKAPPEPPWSAKRFADTFGKPDPQARGVVMEAAQAAGLSNRMAKDLLRNAVDCGFLFSWKEGGANSTTLIATAGPPELPLTDGTAAAEPASAPIVDGPGLTKSKSPRKRRKCVCARARTPPYPPEVRERTRGPGM